MPGGMAIVAVIIRRGRPSSHESGPLPEGADAGASYDVGCTLPMPTGAGPFGAGGLPQPAGMTEPAVVGGRTFAGEYSTAPLAARCCGSTPGRSCRHCSPTATGPVFGSKRTISVISFCIPPTSSHGSHTL
jgi:hypothetical protein